MFFIPFKSCLSIFIYNSNLPVLKSALSIKSNLFVKAKIKILLFTFIPSIKVSN